MQKADHGEFDRVFAGEFYFRLRGNIVPCGGEKPSFCFVFFVFVAENCSYSSVCIFIFFFFFLLAARCLNSTDRNTFSLFFILALVAQKKDIFQRPVLKIEHRSFG